LAKRSITLVRNDDGLLPLRLAADTRVAVVQPQPVDMTPADTSSFARPMLAEVIRRRHGATDEYVVEAALDEPEAEALASRLAGYDLIVLGTVAANLVPAQAAFARRVVSLGRPTVTVALRTPWDVCAYPEARTHVCTYGILAPTMEALGAALFGEIPFRGRLPVEIAGLHARGHGLT
jgi:beta-N-acetylhexosaminidase